MPVAEIPPARSQPQLENKKKEFQITGEVQISSQPVSKPKEIKIQDEAQFDIKPSSHDWSKSLNKQGSVEIALIAKEKENQLSESKNKKDILSMIGQLKSIEVNDKVEIPEDLFSDSLKGPHSNQVSQAESSQSNPSNNPNPSSQPHSKESQSNTQSDFLQDTIKSTQSKYGKQDLSSLSHKIDDKADTSDMQKWKTSQRVSLDHEIPDLKHIKSKIDTGMKQLSSIDQAFKHENDLLKKEFDKLEKERAQKMEDYRKMLLGMKKEKGDEEVRTDDDAMKDSKKLEMRRSLAEKLKKIGN